LVFVLLHALQIHHKLTYPTHTVCCMHRTTRPETLPNGEVVPTIQVQLVTDEVRSPALAMRQEQRPAVDVCWYWQLEYMVHMAAPVTTCSLGCQTHTVCTHPAQEELWCVDLREVEDDLESRYLRSQRNQLEFALEVPGKGEAPCWQDCFVVHCALLACLLRATSKESCCMAFPSCKGQAQPC
jgi:hypothetical protein